MSARKLIFCLLLSVMLTVTFIPSIAFGAANDPHTITVFGFESYNQESGDVFLEHAGIGGLTYDGTKNQIIGLEGETVTFSVWADLGYSILDVSCYSGQGDSTEYYEVGCDENGNYSFVMPEKDVTLHLTVEENGGGYTDNPDISECGTIIVDGWTMDQNSPAVWYSNSYEGAKLLLSSNNGLHEFDDDNYPHALIGADVYFVVHVPDGRVASGTVNGQDCYAGDGQYMFEASADDVDDDGNRTPGNVISVICESLFEDLTTDEKTSAESIDVGTETNANITNDNKTATFKFIPEESGNYIFDSKTNDDDDYEYISPQGRVLDSNGTVVSKKGKDDPWGFPVYFHAEANQTYYLQATDYKGREATYAVELIENDIEGIDFQPKKPWQLRKDIDVHSEYVYDEAAGDSKKIYYWDVPSLNIGDKLIVTEKGGTEKTYELADKEDWDERVFVNVDDENDILAGTLSVYLDNNSLPVEKNAVGTSKSVTVSYAGNETTVPVSFVENPFTDLTITPASDGVKVEKNDGYPDYYWNWGDTEFVFKKADESDVKYVWRTDGIYNEAEDDWIAVDPQRPIGSYYDENGYVEWAVGENHTMTITVAGFEQTIDITVTGHSHKLKKREGYAATCDREGSKDYWCCTDCFEEFWDSTGKNKKGEEDVDSIPINPNNHEYLTETPEVPAIACQKDGTAAYWTCDACGKMFSDKNGKNGITKPVTIPKHKTVKVAAKAATYKTTGNKEYYQCSACKKCFGDAAGASEIAANSWIIAKLTPKAQPVSVKAAVKTVKVKKLKKKAIKVTPLTVTNAKGTLSYKVVGGNAKSKKALKVNAKNGKVTVKKKTKKGKYTIKVKVTAAAPASGEYNAFTKTVKVTVKVK